MSDKFIHKLFATPVFQFKVKDHEKLNAKLSEYIYDLYNNVIEERNYIQLTHQRIQKKSFYKIKVYV